MRRLRKYFALSPAARTLVLYSLVLLPAVALSLRACGMARTGALLKRLGRAGACDSGTLAPREIARLVDAAAAFLRARCLSRSLVLWHFVRNRGAPAEIRLGVSRLADGKLSAHAWLEYDGLPLNDHADVLQRYAALPSRAKQTAC